MSPLTRAALAAAASLLAFQVQAQYQATYLETSRAWGAVVADFNGDGRDDLFISGHDSDDRIWYATDGGYVPGDQVFDWVDRHDCDAADVDRNGRLDLYCAVGGGKGVGQGPKELWLQDDTGHFTKQLNHGADDPFGRGRIPVFLDFNHDGWPDIYLTNEATVRPDGNVNHNHLFLNQGGTGFVEHITRATGGKGFQCAERGDLNGDGWDDLVVCDGRLPAHIFVNDQAGDFVEWHTPANTGGWKAAKLADMNGDGRQDLVVLSSGNYLQVWLNSGTGERFDTPALNVRLGANGRALTVGDFNRDGLRDIYVVVARLDCKDSLVDVAPDLLFEGRSPLKWLKVAQVQDRYPGCGHLAATLDERRVLLLNGGVSYSGSNYVLSWGD
jgi:hypothetical protein